MSAFSIPRIEADFRSRFERSEFMTVSIAWNSLLAHAELAVARQRTPDSADDYLIFNARSEKTGLNVTLERRIAEFTNVGDYDGTCVLGCYLSAAQNPSWFTEAWSAEGYVTAYDELDLLDDRPSLASFRHSVEASDAFKSVTTAGALRARIATFKA